MKKTHIPVMLEQTLQALHLKTGDNVIDATVGLGGHASEILKLIGPKGKLLGIDRTEEGANFAKSNLKKFGKKVKIVSGDFRNIEQIAKNYQLSEVDAVLFDLGLASWQVDQGFKGLSFQQDGELDMLLTVGPIISDATYWTQNLDLINTVNTWRFRKAKEFINNARQKEIEIVFKIFGDLGNTVKIAKQIVEYRKEKFINSIEDFKQAIGSSNPKLLAPIFQSLRILVNDEYGALAEGINGSWKLVKKGGKVVVISFHSGEDRLVKKILPTLKGAGKMKKFFPGLEEIKKNKRARSAIMRMITKEE